MLLQQVAQRLKKQTRDQDTVARMGGDEFVIVLSAIRDVGDLYMVAERIVSAIAAQYQIQGRTLKVSCSLGISIFPEHGADSESLMKNADAAMYGAKENGRNQFHFFSDEMNAHVIEHSTLEHDLQMALAREELFLMYQPQIDIPTGKLVGLEALLRWRHPHIGLVSPDKFIRVAENSGAIVPIGEWVLRSACSQVRRWERQGLATVPVAVNVSAIQFRQEGVKDLIQRVLTDTGLSPQLLELELTESLLSKTRTCYRTFSTT
jgi:predicted signal transduction protein with EAL and GGDEF domain